MGGSHPGGSLNLSHAHISLAHYLLRNTPNAPKRSQCAQSVGARVRTVRRSSRVERSVSACRPWRAQALRGLLRSMQSSPSSLTSLLILTRLPPPPSSAKFFSHPHLHHSPLSQPHSLASFIWLACYIPLLYYSFLPIRRRPTLHTPAPSHSKHHTHLAS